MIHITNFIYLNNNCKNIISLSIFNYFVVILLGTYSAVNVLFVWLILCIIIPIICRRAYLSYKEKKEQIERSQRLLNTLVCKIYDPKIFATSDCAICLEEFRKRDSITDNLVP